MAIGVLNPNDTTHSTATRPTPLLGGVNQRRWFSDPLNTEIRDHDFNAIIGQIRQCIDHWAIPDVEGDDTLLRQAIQAGAAALTGNIAALQALVGAPAGTSATVKAVPYFNSGSTMATFLASDYSRGLMVNSSLAAWQTALGISAAGKPNVIAFGNLLSTANTIGYFTGVGTMALTGFTLQARQLLDDTTFPAMRATLGVTGAYTDFSALTLDAVTALTLNGAVFTSSVSAPTLLINNKTTNTGYIGLSAATSGFNAANGAYIVIYGTGHVSHGDLLLVSGTGGGEIKLNGFPIGPWATGTNLANASGALDPDRIATGSLPISKIAPIVDQRVVGNVSGGSLSPYPLTPGQVAVLIDYTAADVLLKIRTVDGPGSNLNADFLDGLQGASYATLGSSPTFTGTVTADNFTAINSDPGAGTAPWMALRRDSASPAAADNLGTIYYQGNNVALTNITYCEIMGDIVAPTTGNHSAQLYLRVANAGSLVNVMTVGSGVIVGAPAGSYKGLGTLNAQNGVYEGATKLTCIPLQREFLAHGTVDLDLWDGFAVEGKHEAAHHFARLLREGVDPRDPMKFIAAMKEMQALPGMPTMDDWEHNSMSIGEIFNRLWLAVEMLAVAWMSHVESERETRH